MSSNSILADRDTNAQPKQTMADEKKDTKSLEYHRQVLESRLKDGQEDHTYVSPSDEIMSPATQKLNAFRNKHSMSKSKPKTLFAKTSAKNYEAAKGAAMFADIPKNAEAEDKGSD